MFPCLSVSVVLLSLGFLGCASTRVLTRNEMAIQGPSSVTQEGLVVKVKSFDLKGLQDDPRLAKMVTVTRPSTGQQFTLPWTLLNPPVFEVRITNNTGHIARMSGIVIRLLDAASNVYEPVAKDRLAANIEDSIATANRQDFALDPNGKAQLLSGVRQLRFLDENTQILPGMSETYFIAFALPIEPTAEALNAWFAEQSSLTLKVFEVPTQVDAAGVVTKRVAFEFPLAVKTFRDTYQVNMLGAQTLVSSEPVAN